MLSHDASTLTRDCCDITHRDAVHGGFAAAGTASFGRSSDSFIIQTDFCCADPEVGLESGMTKDWMRRKRREQGDADLRMWENDNLQQLVRGISEESLKIRKGQES